VEHIPADILQQLAASRAEAAELRCQNESLRRELDERLALAEHMAGERGLLRTLIDNMPDHIYVKDRSGRFIIANDAAAHDIGLASPQELVGKSDLDLYPLDCGQKFFTDEQNILLSGQPIIDQVEENINRDGIRRWFSTTKFPFYDALGTAQGIVGISRDITQRIDALEAERLRNRAIELSADGIIIAGCTPGMPVLYVNPAFERITGFTLDEARQRGVDVLLDDESSPEGGDGLRDALRRQVEGRAVLRSLRKDGVAFWSDTRLAIVRERTGSATHFVFTISDISEARQVEEQMTLLATRDALTGLPNRRALMERLTQSIAMCERSGTQLAVAFIDLDRLKYVNDTFGHEAGDLMLQTVADRMTSCVRKSDTLARLGGDEFVLATVHQTPPHPGDLRAILEGMLAKIQEVLALPLMLGTEPFCITCSIGVAVYAQDGLDPDILLKRADAAMYVAKKAGRNRVAWHSPPPNPPLPDTP
jgi:diguanylate cyclase (GGDEF)-like protein/PAS domain S-box-containing protein